MLTAIQPTLFSKSLIPGSIFHISDAGPLLPSEGKHNCINPLESVNTQHNTSEDASSYTGPLTLPTIAGAWLGFFGAKGPGPRQGMYMSKAAGWTFASLISFSWQSQLQCQRGHMENPLYLHNWRLEQYKTCKAFPTISPLLYGDLEEIEGSGGEGLWPNRNHSSILSQAILVYLPPRPILNWLWDRSTLPETPRTQGCGRR